MADINNVDNQFVQIGPVCVLASYSAIINYFSNGTLTIDDLLNKYAIYAGIDTSISKREKEQAISDHYHAYCKPLDMRGFDYLADIVHNANVIGTNQNCRIIGRETGKQAIGTTRRLQLREDLKTNDRLAMGITPSTAGFHARVFGWDNAARNYFIKDPEQPKPIMEDFLATNDIWEYILFEKI